MLNNEEVVEEFLGETQKNKICLPFVRTLGFGKRGAFS